MDRRLVIVRHSWRGPEGRRAALLVALAAAGVILDRLWPLGGPPAHVAFFGIFIAIVSAVASFIHGAADLTLTFLLGAYQVLRTGFVALGRVLKTGLFDAGKVAGKIWDGVKYFATDIVPKFLRWSYDKLLRFSTWLKEKFAPVFRWLHAVKEHIDSLYKTFVRPIVDTIEFIRAVNRVLVAFHVDLLQSLDQILAQVEQRIEEPFLWVRQKITFLENWIDRIVTLDGLLQKLTLIASLVKYAPAWMRFAVNKRTKPITAAQVMAIHDARRSPDLQSVIADAHLLLGGDESEIGQEIDNAIERAREYFSLA